MWSIEDVREELLKLLARNQEPPAKYQPGADIFEDYGIDSLDLIEMLFGIEHKFGVKIVDDTFAEQRLREFDRLVSYLVEQQPADS